MCTDVVRALTLAIDRVNAGAHDPLEAHARVRDMYSWADVARRTERVYDDVFDVPQRSTWERMVRCVQRASRLCAA
jgi:phosphatidylinositol glycan class A protein